VYSADFSKNSELVASGGEDRVIRVWDVDKKATLMTFPDFEVPVAKVRFHPDGSCIAACGHDGCIKLWDLRSRRLLQHYDAHVGRITSIDFHPYGEQLASTGEDGALKIWDLREGRLMHKVIGGQGHKKAPLACAFSPSGGSLATAGQDGLVLTWSCSQATPPASVSAAPVPPSSAPSPARRHPVTTPERAQVRALSESRSRRDPKATKDAPKEAPRATREVAREAPEDFTEMPQDRDRDELPAAAVTDHMQEVPAPLAETLKTMQSHLEIMMRTVQLLDQRLALNEQQVTAMRSELLQQASARTEGTSEQPPAPIKAQGDELLLKPTEPEQELRHELEKLRQLL